MLTLYHAPQSRSSRILWLLEEAGADYSVEYVTIPRMDGSGGPDPRNPHPEKKVPLLVHDGDWIWESAAIALYVGDLFPDAKLAPRIGERGRGPYVSWLAYYAGVMEPVIHFGFLGLGDRADLKRTFRGRSEMDARILGALAEHEYVAGERFTTADILVNSVAQWSRSSLPSGPAMDAYLRRCSARPALARAFAKDAPPS
jgi:glutathione S-transferase